MKLKNIVPTHTEEELLDLNGFFEKVKVKKVNVSLVHDQNIDSGDDFQSPILQKSKKVKFSSNKEGLGIGYGVGDKESLLIKKIDDLEKRFNEKIYSLRIFVEERFFILHGKLDKIIQQKFSSNVDEKDVVGSDNKNDNDGLDDRNDFFDIFLDADEAKRRKEEEERRNEEVEKKIKEEERKN